jgi:transcriptional regulator with XRE-family HTH domain
MECGTGSGRCAQASSGTSSGDRGSGRRGIPAFPFCHVTLRGRKPRPGYPEEPKTLGEHLRKRRVDLGLRQKDAAERLGANPKTYENWEQEKYEPEFRFLPAIIEFLGYDPTPEPSTLRERIRAARHRQGISQEELARRLGIDPSTVTAWESGAVKKRYPRFVELFESYVESL